MRASISCSASREVASDRLLLPEKFGFQDRQYAPEVVSNLNSEALVFRPLQNDIANSFDKRADRLLVRGVRIEQV
jgi:hypothetical protein